MTRILFDVSFTRTQHHPTGIPRTVLRLGDALARQPGVDVVPVALHGRQLRRPYGWEGSTPKISGSATPTGRPGQGPSWWIDTAAPQISALLPVPLRRLLWATYQRLLFDRFSRLDTPVELRAGDILLLADASWNYGIWRAARRVRAVGGQVVLIVHDIMPVRHPEFCSPVFAWAFVRWLHRMLPCSNAVVCNSGTTEADLSAWAAGQSLALPPTGHFRLGHNGAAQVPVGAVRANLAHFMSADAPCFAGVGSIEPKKNYGFLLDTFERLWARGLPARLIIAGRPTAQCRDLVQRLQQHPEQGHRLLALFNASDAEIAHVYRHCRALLLASLFEGFGLPLVEARTQGCMVIANDLPAFRELADAGVFFYGEGAPDELEQLIVRLCADRFMSVPPMPPFTWDDSAAQCLHITEALLAPAARAAQRSRA